MLYELRIYDIVPGKMPDINARFANVTTGLFERHGIRVAHPLFPDGIGFPFPSKRIGLAAS